AKRGGRGMEQWLSSLIPSSPLLRNCFKKAVRESREAALGNLECGEHRRFPIFFICARAAASRRDVVSSASENKKIGKRRCSPHSRFLSTAHHNSELPLLQQPDTG